jgi:hypothetical protein
MSHRSAVTVHLRGAGVPVAAGSIEEASFSFFDYEQRYEFAVGTEEMKGIGQRWVVTISVDPEDEESAAALKRLPNLPTSRREEAAYIRWSPFTVDSAADAPRRVSDWIVGTISNASERLNLSKVLPAEEVELTAKDVIDVQEVPLQEEHGATVAQAEFSHDVIKNLVAAVVGASDPRLALIEALDDQALIPQELKAQLLGEISLERGDVLSVLDAAQSGRALTPQQAQILVQAALTTHAIESDVLALALDLAQASWDRQSRTRVLDQIRQKKSHKMALANLDLVAKLVPVDFAIELGQALLDLTNSSDLGMSEKKAIHLQALRSMLGAGLNETVTLAAHVLELGKVRPFDLWSARELRDALGGNTAAIDLIYRTALTDATEADLRAAGEALLTQEAGQARTKMLSKWLKRWLETGYPLAGAAVPMMELVVKSLAEVHAAHPSSEEAQRDQLSIQRLFSENPKNESFKDAHLAIDSARRPGSAAAINEREDAERFMRASAYIKEHIAGKKRRIIVVGGRPTATTVDAVNEFYEPDDDNWLEWLMANKDEIINRRNITTKIRGDSCVALVLLTGAMGHARSKLARETGKAVNRVIVEVRSTSRDDVRRALFEVTEKLAKVS